MFDVNDTLKICFDKENFIKDRYTYRAITHMANIIRYWRTAYVNPRYKNWTNPSHKIVKQTKKGDSVTANDP